MTFQFSEINIVVIGGQNPAIVSHRFLVEEKILGGEVDTPEPVITPMLAQLSYENFQITVDPKRLQIKQRLGSVSKPFINKTVAKYYSRLKYTPVTAYGINLFGEVDWGGAAPYAQFKGDCFTKGQAVAAGTGDPDWLLGYSILFQREPLMVKINVDPPSKDWKSDLNVNCHRDLPEEGAVSALIEELPDIDALIESIHEATKSMLDGN